MKTKVLLLLLAACVLAVAARFAYVPNPAQADNISEKYRDTVQKGLEHLVKNQCKDGHWEGDGGKHPVAMTALAGIALLMEKETSREDGRGNPEYVREAKYAANIRKAADWLLDKSQAGRDGLLFSEHPSETARYMEGHGLATLFLAGVLRNETYRAVLGNETDRAHREKLTDILTRAGKYIAKAQSSQGGWYHTSRVEGHDFDTIAATVIQVQALQAAENAGIPVPRETMNDAQAYLKTALGKDEAGAKPVQNRGQPAEMAAALACQRRAPTDELGKHWFKVCQAEIAMSSAIKFGRDELTHYYYAQAVFSVGGDNWNTYRAFLFDHLQSSQNKDGSWPAGDGLGVGPVYATAVWCTILQLDKKSHPSGQPEELFTF